MSLDYASTAESTALLLEKFGAIGQIQRCTEGAYDTATGKQTKTYTSSEAAMVVLGYKQSAIDGTLIRQGDMRALIEPGTTCPQTGDMIVWQGKTWSVVNAETVAPAGVSVLHKAQLRA
jgi:hypothetical protein